ncbi:MAG: lipase family protein [Cyanobacteria bacterium P01_A01_bin.135]
MKLSRRQLIWLGLGSTAATVYGQEVIKDRALNAEQAALRELYDPDLLVEEAFRSDIASIQELVSIQQSASLRSPTTPYSRKWSKLLITASKLSTQQYLRGRYDSEYDGSVSELPLYTESFSDFEQIATFKTSQRVKECINFEVPISDLADFDGDLGALEKRLDETRDSIRRQVKQAVKLNQRVPVYYGFLLTSPKANLLIFRGTQRRYEVFEDIIALQEDYTHPVNGRSMGKVHFGFYSFYMERLAEAVKAAVASLDPDIPLYISGHSLGSALSTFAAMDIGLSLPKFRLSTRIYSYAGPRVGDTEFIDAHNQLLPNHYRVVNLADMIPMMPLSRLLVQDFVHGGEQWSFLSQQGDILPNHLIETYRLAIEQEAETQSDDGFKNMQIQVDLSRGGR